MLSVLCEKYVKLKQNGDVSSVLFIRVFNLRNYLNFDVVLWSTLEVVR